MAGAAAVDAEENAVIGSGDGDVGPCGILIATPFMLT
jgi:hypothetical protein